MDTIVVEDSYTVAAGRKLTFVDTDGFLMRQVDTSSPVELTNHGTVKIVAGDDQELLFGVTTDDTGPTKSVVFVNAADGVFTIKATAYGQFTWGAYLNFGHSVFENDGLFSVSGGSQALGVTAGLHSQIINTGEMDVSCFGGEAVGVRLNQGGDILNTGQVHIDTSDLGVGFWGGDVDNEGELQVTSTDVAYGALLDMNGRFINAGQITVQGGANGSFGVSIGAHLKHFENSGHITAQSSDPAVASVGVLFDGYYGDSTDTHRAVNSGTIEGDYSLKESTGDSTAAMKLDVVNAGALIGDVDLGFYDDALHNSGSIVGDVLLGQGDDLYEALRHGRLDGALSGGIGDDTLICGKGHDVIHGDEGSDGGQDGQDFLAGGKGNDALSGDGGADTLAGGAGGDTLSGGLGKDVLVFQSIADSTPDHADLITDLTGGDLIDLSAIDADASLAGDQAFVLVASLDGHAGQAALSYDAGSNLTSLSLDVDGDGVADALITLTGDHTDFSNFVL